MAFQEVGERVERLETVLKNFPRNSDAALAEIRQDIAEMRQWRIESQVQWAELCQKLGSFAEDIVVPEIRRIGFTVFGVGSQEDEVFSASRPWFRDVRNSSEMREFEYVLATTKGWVIVESREEPELADVDSFLKALAEANDYFPQFAALPLYPVFASVRVPEDVVHYCTSQRIYAFGMGTETMQLLNVPELAGGK